MLPGRMMRWGAISMPEAPGWREAAYRARWEGSAAIAGVASAMSRGVDKDAVVWADVGEVERQQRKVEHAEPAHPAPGATPRQPGAEHAADSSKPLSAPLSRLCPPGMGARKPRNSVGARIAEPVQADALAREAEEVPLRVRADRGARVRGPHPCTRPRPCAAGRPVPRGGQTACGRRSIPTDPSGSRLVAQPKVAEIVAHGDEAVEDHGVARQPGRQAQQPDGADQTRARSASGQRALRPTWTSMAPPGNSKDGIAERKQPSRQAAASERSLG